MESQFIVVAYDIRDNRRRTKVFKALKNFGTPVQESVFECVLDKQAFQSMKSKVNQVMDVREDAVRYYVLCGSCRERIAATGVPITQEQVAVFVG